MARFFFVNRRKTATKLADYAACGIVALCLDVVPYRHQVRGRMVAAAILQAWDRVATRGTGNLLST